MSPIILVVGGACGPRLAWKLWRRLISQMVKEQYPETKLLSQVEGVGTLTALTFVLTIADKNRFTNSRDVGCYLGLRPKRSQSGGHDPQLGITKAAMVTCGSY